MVTSPDAPEIRTYIEISLKHPIFQAVLHRSWSQRNCNCVDDKISVKNQKICHKKICTNLFCQPTILDIAFCVFIIESNGEARRRPAKNAEVLAVD